MNKVHLVKPTDLLLIPIGLVTLLALHWESVLFVLDASGRAQSYFTTQANTVFSTFGDFITNTFLTADVATFLVWSAIGLVCYLLASLFLSKVHEISELKTFDQKYRQPKKQRSRRWQNFAATHAIIAVLLLSLAAWFYISLVALMPYANLLMLSSFINSDSILEAALSVTLAVASISLIYFVPIVLFRTAKAANVKLAS